MGFLLGRIIHIHHGKLAISNIFVTYLLIKGNMYFLNEQLPIMSL